MKKGCIDRVKCHFECIMHIDCYRIDEMCSFRRAKSSTFIIQLASCRRNSYRKFKNVTYINVVEIRSQKKASQICSFDVQQRALKKKPSHCRFEIKKYFMLSSKKKPPNSPKRHSNRQQNETIDGVVKIFGDAKIHDPGEIDISRICASSKNRMCDVL